VLHMYARTSTGTVLLIGPDRFYVIVFGTGFGSAVPWKGERDNVEPECPGYYKQARGASSKALTGGTSTSEQLARSGEGNVGTTADARPMWCRFKFNNGGDCEPLIKTGRHSRNQNSPAASELHEG
jgi:hypothetical protein